MKPAKIPESGEPIAPLGTPVNGFEERDSWRPAAIRAGSAILDAKIWIDGRPTRARAGETLAAALLAAGIVALRRSPTAGAPRGAFCMMGVCQECMVTVDGRRAQACLTMVRDGMSVALDAEASDETS